MYKKIYYVKKRFLRSLFFTIFTILKLFSKISSPNAGYWFFESFSKRRTPTATLRYEPCIQFINVSQRTLHIYWQPSAMSLAIHKIASKRRCQSYFISRRSPHHGISKDSDLCASAHRCPHYAYARLIARVTLNLLNRNSIVINRLSAVL